MDGGFDGDLRARAEAAHAELLDVVADALASTDPVMAAELLLDLVRGSAEVRARAERALGLLLTWYPDDGGRPRKDGGETQGRAVRRVLGINATHRNRLVQLADIDDATFAELIDEIWSGYPRLLGARALIVASQDRDPTPSMAGD